MSVQARNEGNELVIKAEEKLTAKFYPFGNRYEDALQLYSRAAIKYKKASEWERAGTVYMRMVSCFQKLKDKTFDIAECYSEAATCYRHTSEEKAIQCLGSASALYLDICRFELSAKLEREMAEFYEQQNKYDLAIKHFQRSAEFLDGENQDFAMYLCMLKVADLQAIQFQYSNAFEEYDRCHALALQDKNKKLNLNDLRFRMIVCLLGSMTLTNFENMDRITRLHNSFLQDKQKYEGSKEADGIARVVQSVTEKNEMLFVQVLQEFAEEQWYATILERLKPLTVKKELDLTDL